MAKRTRNSNLKNALYCSFCGKSEHEIRKLIAGPTVFICEQCTDLCADIVIDGTNSAGISEMLPVFSKKLKSYRLLDFPASQSAEAAAKILRSIEFLPEHRQAGIGILNYFSKYLSERYPEISVKVVIEQESNKVRMTIESEDGHLETVEETLEEYALTVTGIASPGDFLSNQYQVMELDQKLEMATWR